MLPIIPTMLLVSKMITCNTKFQIFAETTAITLQKSLPSAHVQGGYKAQCTASIKCSKPSKYSKQKAYPAFASLEAYSSACSISFPAENMRAGGRLPRSFACTGLT